MRGEETDRLPACLFFGSESLAPRQRRPSDGISRQQLVAVEARDSFPRVNSKDRYKKGKVNDLLALPLRLIGRDGCNAWPLL